MSHPLPAARPVWTGPADVHGYAQPAPEELDALAASLTTDQRDMLARAWAGRARYQTIAQVPAAAAVLRSLMDLGLVSVPADQPGPTTTARGRTVLGRMPQRVSLSIADCTCVVSCADDPASACSLSGQSHVHPDDGSGTFGACPVHPDAPGDL